MIKMFPVKESAELLIKVCWKLINRKLSQQSSDFFRWHLQWNFNWINACYSHQYGWDNISIFIPHVYAKLFFKHQWNHWNFRSHEYTFTHTVTREKIISPIHPPTFFFSPAIFAKLLLFFTSWKFLLLETFRTQRKLEVWTFSATWRNLHCSTRFPLFSFLLINCISFDCFSTHQRLFCLLFHFFTDI